jgi:hypothetical protein
VFVDELEKGLSGVGSQGDSGVSTRLFGNLLTWLADHESDVFFVGTSNDISKMPPEFTRAERLDGVFFLDLPSVSERDAIWSLFRSHYGISANQSRPDDTSWTGAEIKACCRLAALLDVPLTQAAVMLFPSPSPLRSRWKAFVAGRAAAACVLPTPAFTLATVHRRPSPCVACNVLFHPRTPSYLCCHLRASYAPATGRAKSSRRPRGWPPMPS